MKEEQVLASFVFLPGQQWEGAIDVVQLKTPEGHESIGIGMRLPKALGRKRLYLPRRGLEEIVSALSKAVDAASAAYKNIIRGSNR